MDVGSIFGAIRTRALNKLDAKNRINVTKQARNRRQNLAILVPASLTRLGYRKQIDHINIRLQRRDQPCYAALPASLQI